MIEMEIKLSSQLKELKRTLGTANSEECVRILLKRLRQLCGNYGARLLGERKLLIYDRYYDTAKRDFAIRKASLRARQIDGESTRLSLKLPCSRARGEFVRDEIEFEIKERNPGAFEGMSVIQLVEKYVRPFASPSDLKTASDLVSAFEDRELKTTVEIHNERNVLDFEIDENNFFALYVDKFRASNSKTGRTSDGFEVEFEYVLSGDKQAFEMLRNLSQILQTAYAFNPSERSKYEYGLELQRSGTIRQQQ